MTTAVPQSDVSRAQTLTPSSANLASMDCDVLIIGAGLAGLSTALSLPTTLKVIVLSKKELTACSSHYAQGGIAASLAAEDSVEDHIADTLVAGDGLCDSSNTAEILTAGAKAVAWLQAQGVPFTLQEQAALENGDTQNNHSTADKVKVASGITTLPSSADLHLTQEGGHGRRRVAHADDATGYYIMQTLSQRILDASNITVLTGYEALELLTGETIASEKVTSEPSVCTGALVFASDKQRLVTINSAATVLATGGLGQLFQRATAPDVCMGDGMMMAWQAGCRLANLEFVQFHPTGLALDNSNFLISEALRGEGAYLRCPLTGERFMAQYDERLELAPRDIVARAIAAQIKQNGLGYVHLDISHQPSAFIRQHFPQIDATLSELGIDMTRQPIPVAPTAHYSCGGVVATADGLTDVTGLYAAGEVAYTGLHGANRLASNSLLECVVVGRRIATHIPNYLDQISNPTNNIDENIWQPLVVPNGYVVEKTEGAQSKTINNLVLTKTVLSDTAKVAALKLLMSHHLGISRNALELQQALQQVQAWQDVAASDNKLDSNLLTMVKSATKNLPETLNNWRWQRLLHLATLMLQAALSRSESRGGHFRSDFPDSAAAAQVSIITPLLAAETSTTANVEKLIPISALNASKTNSPTSLSA